MDASRLAVAIACWTLTVTAHAGAYGIGTRPTDAQIAAWNIDVAPDGKALPPGRGTVEQGHAIYDRQCAACHGLDLQGGMGPALAGGVGSLASEKPLKTVGSYWPYATTLFDYIRRTMPLASPQTLSSDELYALVGYVLFRNGIVPAGTTVDAAQVVNVRMPNREGFYLDDRPDTKERPCDEHCLRATKK
ncbi:cytochrome c [Panacagrimonas perspica]|uniref:Cytochrome c n=1 Tax=Panacagrimonas perspica TaxID=381431 RepID=A0A4R7NZ04_9GAMM|nr:cytochrome c [Panacagrimonas perspica]TDU26477.1 cytochrome c [Panacagrimonas perspica]THD02094.1 cytochrome C [Panacagrimonas perspica]